ncbi:MAG: type II toxin-antitoxin system RelB/DinJ family antitoxin [Acidobacteriaceae bacterium]|jgi:DNA-damage-inducible protein J
MGTTAIVQATVETSLRDQASAVLAELGMTVDDALRLLLAQVVEEHDLPLSMHIPNAETITAMREADSGAGKRYSSLDALFKDMRG